MKLKIRFMKTMAKLLPLKMK